MRLRLPRSLATSGPKLLTAITLMLAFLPTTAAAQQEARATPTISPDIKAAVDSVLCCSRRSEQLNMPGYAVAIVQGNDVVYRAISGLRNRSENLPMTAETLFNIASVTKTFTATLALILRDQGLIDLDDPVADYLPSHVVVPSGTAADTPITIYHLLTHTSGLPTDPPNRKNMEVEGLLDPGVGLPYDIEDLYAGLSQTTLQSPVGARWNYSNYGFGLLGHVLERATGETFEILLKKHIFEPLGMHDTTITLEDEHLERMAGFYWVADPERNERPRKIWGEVPAAGGITSSLHDMAKFAAFQLKTVDRPGDPLSLVTLDEMRIPHIDFDVFRGRPRPPEFQNREFGMGLGWWIHASTDSDDTQYWHGGDVDGHSAMLIYSTETNRAIVALVNLGGQAAIWLGLLLRDLILTG